MTPLIARLLTETGFATSPGAWAPFLLLFGVALVVLIVIDDDDLPGPRLCRVKAN